MDTLNKLTEKKYNAKEVLSLTYKVAQKYNLYNRFSREEFQSIGNIAWCRAAQKYKKGHKAKFTTYLWRIIFSEMRSELRCSMRLAKYTKLERTPQPDNRTAEFDNLELINKIPIKRSKEIFLDYYNGLSMHDISRRRNMSWQNVQRIIRSCRKTLKGYV